MFGGYEHFGFMDTSFGSSNHWMSVNRNGGK